MPRMDEGAHCPSVPLEARKGNFLINPFQETFDTQVFVRPLQEISLICEQDNAWFISFQLVKFFTFWVIVVIEENRLLGVAKPIIGRHFSKVGHFTVQLHTLLAAEVDEGNYGVIHEFFEEFTVHFFKFAACNIE